MAVFILLHNPSLVGINGLEDTANQAKKSHVLQYIQQLISPAPFVSNLALSLPHDA